MARRNARTGGFDDPFDDDARIEVLEHYLREGPREPRYDGPVVDMLRAQGYLGCRVGPGSNRTFRTTDAGRIYLRSRGRLAIVPRIRAGVITPLNNGQAVQVPIVHRVQNEGHSHADASAGAVAPEHQEQAVQVSFISQMKREWCRHAVGSAGAAALGHRRRRTRRTCTDGYRISI